MASMINIRRSCTQENAPVSNEYQAVPYVMGLGNTTVIDTGVNGDNDNLRFKFCFSPEFFANYGGFFGNYNSESANSWRMIFTTTDNSFYVTRNKITSSSLIARFSESVLNKKIFCDISAQKQIFYADGQRLYDNTIRADGTHNNRNIAIGSNSVTTTGAISNRPTKWYYFRIWDDGVLIRNYVPCYRKSDNVGGFWESVNRQFVRSVGSKDFELPQ